MKDTFPVMSRKKKRKKKNPQKKRACLFETLDNHVLQGKGRGEAKKNRKKKRRELIAFSTFQSERYSSDKFIAFNCSFDDLVRQLDLKKWLR